MTSWRDSARQRSSVLVTSCFLMRSPMWAFNIHTWLSMPAASLRHSGVFQSPARSLKSLPCRNLCQSVRHPVAGFSGWLAVGDTTPESVPRESLLASRPKDRSLCADMRSVLLLSSWCDVLVTAMQSQEHSMHSPFSSVLFHIRCSFSVINNTNNKI